MSELSPVKETQKQDTTPPKKYAVKIHNDDFTPFDFVVVVLVNVFAQPVDSAFELTSQIHSKGSAIAGVYSREIAETKIEQLKILAERAQYPLLATLEATD